MPAPFPVFEHRAALPRCYYDKRSGRIALRLLCPAGAESAVVLRGDPYNRRKSGKNTRKRVFAQTPVYRQLKRTVWYRIFPGLFRRGSGSNAFLPPDVGDWEGGTPTRRHFFGGNIAGIREKLSELADLGVNGLYLTPIFQSPSGHKYNLEGSGDQDGRRPVIWDEKRRDGELRLFFQRFVKFKKDFFPVIADCVLNYYVRDNIHYREFSGSAGRLVAVYAEAGRAALRPLKSREPVFSGRSRIWSDTKQAGRIPKHRLFIGGHDEKDRRNCGIRDRRPADPVFGRCRDFGPDHGRGLPQSRSGDLRRKTDGRPGGRAAFGLDG